MKKTLEYVRKAFGLVLKGYSGWVIYRAARYFRSYFSPTYRANSVSPEWLSQSQIHSAMEEFNHAFQKTQTKKALCAHLFYCDVLQEILQQPLVQEDKLDFYISIGSRVDKDFFAKLEPYKGRVKLYQFSNRGRDVYPFLKIYPDLLSYEWVCKIHSKRSPQIRDGELWRQDLIGDLLGVESFSRLRECPSTSVIAPKNSLLPVSLFIGGNEQRMRELLKKMGLNFPSNDFLFVAGTMFWFRPQTFKKLLELVDLDSLFEEESSTIDGLTAHAFERLFYFIANENSKV